MAIVAPAQPTTLTSAGGVLSLLEEDEVQLRVHALQTLDGIVDHYWSEIADKLSAIEQLYEDEAFPQRDLAALVASKVLYHLEEYEDSLRLALGAGRLFDLATKTEYVETMVSKAIDEYIRRRKAIYNEQQHGGPPENVEPAEPMDTRLEAVVELMFEKCRKEGHFKQGLGIALESHLLDKVKLFITSSPDPSGMISYCMRSIVSFSRAFRKQVLSLLVSVYQEAAQGESSSKEFAAICQCYCFLEDDKKVAEILESLLERRDPWGRLMAFQIGFDLAESEEKHFCQKLLANPKLKRSAPVAPEPEEGQEQQPVPEESEAEAELRRNFEQLASILSGTSSIELHLEFLFRNNHTDLLLLDQIKAAVDQRNSTTHTAVVLAHSLMQCGTTSDVFLRNNLEWLGKAVNWAKFTATASLGVIHKGHIKESRAILSTYLPREGGAGSPYSEGGALYAMGLIHANHRDAGVQQYLLDQLKNSNAQNSEVIQHGACLGLGLTCMATGDEGVYEELKQALYTDNAITGESAGYAMGLVMVGTADQRAIPELLTYAHDTQHEKIIRSCAMALAFIMFRREEEADTLIEQLLGDKDAILRYGGCFTIGLAYCGTSHNAAIRKLLHVSVSDVSDDVRRAAVLALGFVLCNAPEQLPGVVKLLSESYNPHVRYGAALAVGIACAGSALPEAVALLEPLTTDVSDFVRQGALLAMGLVYMQATDAQTDKKVGKFREQLTKVLGDKHEDVMCRFGAILAAGLLDAGGRNCCGSFFSKAGTLRMGTAVGYALFLQMWYWFPLIHGISLALHPTALIGLNEKLKMPANFTLQCRCRPSMFAYPEPVKLAKKEKTDKVETAVLSTAAKASALKDQKKEDKEDKGDKDEPMPDAPAASSKPAESEASATRHDDMMSIAATMASSVTGDDMEDMQIGAMPDAPTGMDGFKSPRASGEDKDATGPTEGKTEEEAKEEKEPEQETLSNPCRVVPTQEPFIHFSFAEEAVDDVPAARYVPILKSRKSGFLLLQDRQPGQPEDLIQSQQKGGHEEEEPGPPEPFEWSG